MNETSISLLQRLRDSTDDESWDRLVQLYQPLLSGWLKRYSLQASDAEDLVQEVLVAVAKDLPSFEHNGRQGAFRAWLKTTLIHRLRNYWRQRDRTPRVEGDTDFQAQLNALEDPHSALNEQWNREHDRHIAERLLADTERSVSAQTWEAFRRVTLDAQGPAQAAEEMGISVNAVFIAKSRVLMRLRQQAAGLLDSSGDFLDNSMKE